jgi:hypothetical protein
MCVLPALFYRLDLKELQRTRYLNAANTFKELLSMGVVPIVNENDTVSVSVCGFFSPLFYILLVLTFQLGNQIWGQRYPFCYYSLYDSCRLSFLAHRC